MICPHCQKNLLRRQRTNSKCTYCDRVFAFDPKTNDLQLHDVKVRRQAARLAEGGLSFTPRQLWYAVSRSKVSQPVKPLEGCGCGTFLFLFFAMIVFGVAFQPREEVFAGVAIGAVGVLITVNVVFAALRPFLAARKEIRPPVPEVRFRSMLADWRRVYGASPAGMIDSVAPQRVQAPEAAVVCHDETVLDCLTANGFPHRTKVALATRANGVPPGVPVVLLHDASVTGLRFAAATRAALPGRVVVDAGLRPSTVLRHRGLLRLRGERGSWVELHDHGLSREEIEWLTAGWWSPIGAVPPAKLLSAVDRALARTDRARAVEVGFMTWPE